jgi:hypothetical protein
MSVHHRGTNILVRNDELKRTDVITLLQLMRRNRMVKCNASVMFTT